MIDIPFVIEPPDIIVIEVLEALPGRPITGERLVKSDGTISLGFYGDVHVRGLTTRQAKVKIIHHLRNYLTEEVLGLFLPSMGEEELMQEEANPPFPIDPDLDPPPADEASPPLDTPSEREIRPNSAPDDKPKLSRGPKRRSLETTSLFPTTIGFGRGRFASSRVATGEPVQDPQPEASSPKKQAEPAANRIERIDPEESLRVFVDFSSLNSKVYLVQGDVGVPGRLPITGKETVLDALNYAGGLRATAEPLDIHLYRPARGGKPTKDYRIDLEAIHRGDAKANLQIFPDDRLIVGRNAIVKKTVELDRVAASLNSVFNSILQYNYGVRSLARNKAPFAGDVEIKIDGQTIRIPTNPAGSGDADMKEWFEFLWDLTSHEGKPPLDEQAIRDAVLKKLAAPPASKPDKD
ncbi:polysaccharide biosynthesis/export family protein [Tundrisphaera lichenicola]|uniref:polysaccharide biosynthesis/export family protein n=1 Tax=Tundrisphaera lichenicola TaxID=2029860 RepID=UPI003EBE551D